ATGIGVEFGAAGKGAIPALIQALWDEHWGVRSSAAEALGRMGPAAAPATPALIALLESPEEDWVHSAAAEALGQIGPGAEAALPALREKLKHPDSYVRVHAALALWLLGSKRDGLAEATAGLHDRRDRVRVTAAEALWRLRGDKEAIAVLIEVLEEAKLDA